MKKGEIDEARMILAKLKVHAELMRDGDMYPEDFFAMYVEFDDRA